MADYEKNAYHSSPEGSALASDYNTEVGENYNGSKGAFGRWVDNFKRDPNAHTTPKGTVGADGNVSLDDVLKRDIQGSLALGL